MTFRIVCNLAAGLALAVSPLLSGAAAVAAERVTPAAGKIDFNRQIRPILSGKCFLCHGPDEANRQSGLRLDVRENAIAAAESGAVAIVPGKAEESALVERIFADDESMRMPPVDHNKQLTEDEKKLLKQWVAEGAEYQPHWAFRTVERPPVPEVKERDWVRNPIDAFVLAYLNVNGLSHAPEADRATLIRRLTLDLTGLPPTLEEVDAFLDDESPDAYEKVVDRLLASPHYGERMALDWLDAARFADTNGYHIDNGRDMTAWRDWVINAYNTNKPFDQFTIEQLAGDLLPNATLENKIASGFNRNNMVNFEGGAIPEEYHAAYVMDRVNTTGTVWLGLTAGCSQCHDHKFDPLKQKEYYQLYAFFNTVAENGLDGRKGNSAPYVKAPMKPEQKIKLEALDLAEEALEEKLTADDPRLDEGQAAWEASMRERKPWDRWTVVTPAVTKSLGGTKLAIQKDGMVVASGPNPAKQEYTVLALTPIPRISGVRVEIFPDEAEVNHGPGRSITGNFCLSDFKFQQFPNRDIKKTRTLRFKSATADYAQEAYGPESAIDDSNETAWAIYPEMGKPHHAIFKLRRPYEPRPETRLIFELDFNGPFEHHAAARFRVSVTSSDDPHGELDPPPEAIAALDIPPERRTPEQRAAVRRAYRLLATPLGEEARSVTELLENERKEVEESIPTVMVMQEMQKPRDTFLLMRGQYDKLGEKVTPNTPAFLPPLPEGVEPDRLALAKWLVNEKQPLTPRVTANRIWQMFFGTGIVSTAGDFGLQGELPTHPELLEWLSAEFMRSSVGQESPTDWDMKRLVRTIVTSSTYRQSSNVSQEAAANDPTNRHLARGARFRLHAEFVRDQALAVSGLLNGDIGGHSVSPYQPPGLWEELATRSDGEKWTAQEYHQSHGRDLYRRGMYTFWKRTSPPPSLITFDAPDRETCTVRRARTNTPLQALVLMNSPTYIEAARKLAERLMEDPLAPVEEQIAMGFRMATGREATEREIEVLRKVFDEQLTIYKADIPSADRLLSVGESPRDRKLDAAQLAALTIVANTILNLDETITRS